MLKLVAAALLAVALYSSSVFAGEEPTFDFTNEQTFRESMDRVKASLSPIENEVLLKAMIFIGIKYGDRNGMTNEELRTMMKPFMDGRTAKEVIWQAEHMGPIHFDGS